MKIEITAKNYEVSQKLRNIIEKKVQRLDKYFDDDATAKILCKQENNILKLELNVRSKGLFYRAEVAGENMYENIDLALPKVERQIVKYAEKFRDKFRKGTDFATEVANNTEFKERSFFSFLTFNFSFFCHPRKYSTKQ